MKIWRLVSGVLSMVAFLIILFQSFAAGLYNFWENNDDNSDSGGVFVAFGLLVAGIVTTTLWKNKSKGSDIALIVLYSLTALVGFVNLGTYRDLVIWSSWSLLCAIIAIISLVIKFVENNGKEIEYVAPRAAAFSVNNAKKRVCPHCHAEIDSDSTFCSSCGKKIPEKSFCRSCGNRIEISDEYCPFCGSKQNDNIKSAHYTNFATVEQSRLQSNVPEEQNCNYVITESQDVVSSSQTNQYDGSLIKWIIIGLILFLIIVGAGIFFVIQYNSSDRSNSEGNRGNIEEKVTLTSNKKTYNMRGAISKYPITMQIEINGSQINGYYYYNRQYDKIGTKAYLNVTGTYENGYIDMNETNSEGTPTGHFQGWLKNNFFKGNFINTNGEQMPFVVSSQ